MPVAPLSSNELPAEALVLGIDAGGTKTVAWLAPLHEEPGDDERPSIVGRGQAGPGNPRAVGFDTAQSNYEAALVAAFCDAGLPRQMVEAACFAVAGAGRSVEQQRVRDWAHRLGIARRVVVTHDAEPVLAAASPSATGVALISGTGSLAWGKNTAGDTARCGGWGYRIGDEGSGYAVAVAGLRAAARAADGRGPPTKLLAAFLDHLHLDTPQELVPWLYEAARTRDAIAELASLVFEAAAHDDAARDILATAADDLAELVVTLAKRLDLAARHYCLAVAGGVLSHQTRLRDACFARIAERGRPPERMVVVTDPVAGAVQLARALSCQHL